MKSNAAILRNGFLVFLLIPSLLLAQKIEIGGSNKHVNYERLSRIDSLVNSYIAHKWINGATTIIVKDNQLVQYKGYGYADVDSKKKMQKDELVRIASQTKALTCTGIMILYEHGKILLNEPVSDFIPEFKNMTVLDKFNAADTTYTTVPAKRPITIRDLLTHTSGLDYPGIGSQDMQAIYAKAGIAAGFNIAKKGQTLLAAMQELATLPLVHQPGEKWTYGLNYDLLGCIIEVVSNKNLADFFKENIFEPLDMKDTYFNVPASKAGRLATVYREDSLHHVIKWEKGYFGADPDYPLAHKQYFSGGADLTSTAFDYAVFLQMLLNGGTYNGHEILSPRSVDMMTSNQLDFSYNGTDGFGLGFDIVSEKGAARGPKNKGSFSWGGFFGSSYWADPKEHLIGIIFTQQTPDSHADVMERFQNMVYASLKE
ncbi:MAG: serine hydrolase domain-containing protein [Ginsengibacter sp.]